MEQDNKPHKNTEESIGLTQGFDQKKKKNPMKDKYVTNAKGNVKAHHTVSGKSQG